VYEPQTISLTAGDRIRIAKNFQNNERKFRNDELHPRDLLELGRRIRCAREINGRSQEAFADVCSLDRSYFGATV
jgi:hypothetical protein